MALPNSQQVSLRDALEVVPLFDGSYIPISGEAKKFSFGSTCNNIEELIEKLKLIYAPTKSVYQLQRELGNIYMWEKQRTFLCS